MSDDQKKFVVTDQDDNGKTVGEYPTKDMAEARVTLLSSQGAHPGRYKIEEKKGDDGPKGNVGSMSGSDPTKDYEPPPDKSGGAKGGDHGKQQQAQSGAQGGAKPAGPGSGAGRL